MLSPESSRMSQCDFRVFGLATRAAAANEAEDSSAVKGNAVAAIKQAVCTGARDLHALREHYTLSPSGLHGSVADGRARRRCAAGDRRRAGSRRVLVTRRRVCSERVHRACRWRALRTCPTPPPQSGTKWQGAARVDSATSPFGLPAMPRRRVSMLTGSVGI